MALDGRNVRVAGYEDGNFIGPTVFTDVKTDMDIYTNEIFGPVLLVLTANKPITKQNLLASLIQEIEKQPDDYFQRLHRAAIEMIGVNGR
ncbi:MAG: hypothetical protein DI557_23850 [Serratia marcescens]|nr:MAG: hypothetical protein DI557_23850 [Serratia marcescens]